MQDRFKIGIITKPHGVKGEVKVYPTTDDLNRFKSLKKCYLVPGDARSNKEEIITKKTSAKIQGNMVILGFDGFIDMNSVEKLRNFEIYVDREDAVKLEEGEFFYADVIDMEVYLTDGTKLGILTDCLETGANDVFEVTYCEEFFETEQGANVTGKSVLIPVIKSIVLDIDFDANKVLVEPMKGLFE